MESLTRRSAVASALAMAAAPRVAAAERKWVVALVGAGGRGIELGHEFRKRPDVELRYVCDIHPQRLAGGVRALGGEAKPVEDYRRLLELRDVDAVILATPDHWHALGAVWACQAGKDVYVEKPCSHDVVEGRKMVEAARRYRRIVQVGTQNRSAPYALQAREYIRAGHLGDIHLVKVYNMKPGAPFRLGPDDPAPPGFAWDVWLGPTPARPHNSSLFGGGWHKYWAYSGGDLADDGVHQIDLASMLMGDPPGPRSVYCAGGRYAYRDDREVPDTQFATLVFDKFLLTLELTQYTPYMDKIAVDIRNSDAFPYWPQCATRIELYGSKGLMYFGRHGGGWQVYAGAKQQSRPGELVAQAYGRVPTSDHVANFLQCMRTRELPNADIEVSHRTTTLVHLANVAHRAGNRHLEWDADAERFKGAISANRLLHAPRRAGYGL